MEFVDPFHSLSKRERMKLAKATPKAYSTAAFLGQLRNQRRSLMHQPLTTAIQGVERMLVAADKANSDDARTVQVEQQIKTLIGFAKENSMILPSDYLDELYLRIPKTNEHRVFLKTADRCVVKATYPDSFGFVMADNERLIPATPAEYLRRLELFNTIFDDKITVEGVLSHGQSRSVITSQPWVTAKDKKSESPTPEQIADFMEKLGFTQLFNIDNAWVRKSDGVKCNDCRPPNFILTRKGVVPIDIIVSQSGAKKPIPAPLWLQKRMTWSRSATLPKLKDRLEQFQASSKPFKLKGNAEVWKK